MPGMNWRSPFNIDNPRFDEHVPVVDSGMPDPRREFLAAGVFYAMLLVLCSLFLAASWWLFLADSIPPGNAQEQVASTHQQADR